MHTATLLLITLVLPLVWGWAMHLLIKWAWPFTEQKARPLSPSTSTILPPDYQI